MYVIGKGHEHEGPGTSLVQHYNLTREQADRMAAASRGMGCSCKGLAGCPCGGLGLFDSGMDVSGWAWPEFAIAGIGAYMLVSTFFTTKRAARRVRGALKGAARGARTNPAKRRRRR